MHTCTSNLLKNICPACKSEHKIEFKTEFIQEKDIPYLTGNCPNCDYKVFFEHDKMTSGIVVPKKLKGLEAKV